MIIDDKNLEASSSAAAVTRSASLKMQKLLPKGAIINTLLNDLRDWFSEGTHSVNRPSTAALTNCGCQNKSKQKPHINNGSKMVNSLVRLTHP
jgi:hypothetical protein